MKRIKKIILIVLILLVMLILCKNIIAKAALSGGVKAITGLDLSMKSINIGIFKTLIGIKELKLYNPSGFPDRLMVDMPEIYVDYDLGAFLKRRVHLEEVRINLKEFVVVKNEKNELNLDALKVVQAKKEKKAPQEQKEKVKMTEFQIDVLELKIGKVIYKDYSRGTPAKVRKFIVNIDERYENIRTPYAFGSLIVTKALMNTTIAKLANFDLGSLKEGLTETLESATTLGKETVQKTLQTGKELGKEAVEAVDKTLDDTTKSIKKIFPFGK